MPSESVDDKQARFGIERMMRSVGLVVWLVSGLITLISAGRADSSVVLTAGLILFNLLVIVLWSYVILSRKDIAAQLFVPGRQKSMLLPRYTRGLRKAAHVTLAVAVLLNIGYLYVACFHYRAPPKDCLRLGVARFQAGRGSSDLAEDTMRLIQDRVQDHKDAGVPIKMVDLSSDDLISSEEKALKAGRKAGAHLVLWGSVARLLGGEIEINYRLTLVAGPVGHTLVALARRRVLVRPPHSYEPLTEQKIDIRPSFGLRFPDQTLTPGAQHIGSIEEIADIVLFCAALAHMRQDQPESVEKARKVFDLVPPRSLIVYAAARFCSGIYYFPCQRLTSRDDLVLFFFDSKAGERHEWEISCVRFEQAYLSAQQALTHTLPQQDRELMNKIRLNSHLNRGAVLCALGKNQGGVAEFHKVIALDRDDPIGHLNLGHALLKQDRVDEAIPEFREAIKLAPDVPGLHYNLGCALEKQGKLDKAIVEYRKEIEINAGFAPAHGNLGRVLGEQGKLGQAIGEFREAIRLGPDHPSLHHNLATALAEQGRLDKAITEYRRAIALDPGYALAYADLAAALLEQGKLDQAVAEYRSAISIEPTLVGAHYGLGITLAEQGKLAEAVAELREVTEIAPNNAVARFSLGVVLKKRGKVDEAIAEWREVTRLSAKDAPADNGLGAALTNQANWDKAIAAAHHNLGGAFHKQGELGKAVVEFSLALKIAPDLPEAWCALGISYAAKGWEDYAVHSFRRYLELRPNAPEAERIRAYIREHE